MSERDALIDATVYRSHAMTARLVTARKSHGCDYSRDSSWSRACHTIQPGEQYVRVTVFPGHDYMETPRPTSGACCLPCAEGYIGLDTLTRPTPPAQPQDGAR